MATRKLSRMVEHNGLDSSVVNVFHARALLTAKEVLSLTELELAELLDINCTRVAAAVNIISNAACPSASNLQELLKKRKGRKRVRLRMMGLDSVMGGGLPNGLITEIVGPAGVGKTQACLMLSLFTCLPEAEGGLAGSVLYIDMERKFNAQRLVEMAGVWAPGVGARESELAQVLSKILVVTPASADDLLEMLRAMEAEMIQRQVRLLVLDSIAAAVAGDYGSNTRQEMVGQIASRLKYLAEMLCIPVFAANQVVGAHRHEGQQSSTLHPSFGLVKKRKDEDAGGGEKEDDDDDVWGQKAALGMRWGHSVGVCLEMKFQSHGRRLLVLAKAPMAKRIEFPVAVSTAGVHELTLNVNSNF